MEMKILIVIGIVLFVFAAVTVVVGIIVVSSAAEELYRDLDDLDQARYIRDWQAKQKAKKAGRRKR